MPWPKKVVDKMRKLGCSPLFHERWKDGEEFYSGERGKGVVILDTDFEVVTEYTSFGGYQNILDRGNPALEPFEEEVFDGNI